MLDGLLKKLGIFQSRGFFQTSSFVVAAVVVVDDDDDDSEANQRFNGLEDTV